MAKSPVFDDITAGFISAAKLNSNFDAIETSFANTLSRDGSTPNTMSVDFDMNGNDILNAGTVTAVDVIVNGSSVAASATAAAASAAAAAVSETNAAASAALADVLTTFTNLTDTPGAYVGASNNFVKVLENETGLEFVPGSASEPSDGDKGDITVSGGSGLVWNIDAGVVDTTELATDAVTTVKITDVNVTTAKIALNAVTLNLLEHGTTGDILYYGASGEPFRLAKGSDDEVLTLASGLPSWAASPGTSTEYMHVRDEQSTGSPGGTFTSGAWRTRTLNTSVTNTITGASVAANVITLPAGTFDIEARAPGFRCNGHQARLQNTSDATTDIIGSSANSRTGQDDLSQSFVTQRITIAGAKNFELQHKCVTTRATDGFGEQSDSGLTEIYADIRIWKV